MYYTCRYVQLSVKLQFTRQLIKDFSNLVPRLSLFFFNCLYTQKIVEYNISNTYSLFALERKKSFLNCTHLIFLCCPPIMFICDTLKEYWGPGNEARF